MSLYYLDAMKICEILEIAETNSDCLKKTLDYLLNSCCSEKEIDDLIYALRLQLREVQGIDRLVESIYESVLKDAFEKRATIREMVNCYRGLEDELDY